MFVAEAEVDNDLNAGFADRPLRIPAYGVKVLAIPCYRSSVFQLCICQTSWHEKKSRGCHGNDIQVDRSSYSILEPKFQKCGGENATSTRSKSKNVAKLYLSSQIPKRQLRKNKTCMWYDANISGYMYWLQSEQ